MTASTEQSCHRIFFDHEEHEKLLHFEDTLQITEKLNNVLRQQNLGIELLKQKPELHISGGGHIRGKLWRIVWGAAVDAGLHRALISLSRPMEVLETEDTPEPNTCDEVDENEPNHDDEVDENEPNHDDEVDENVPNHDDEVDENEPNHDDEVDKNEPNHDNEEDGSRFTMYLGVRGLTRTEERGSTAITICKSASQKLLLSLKGEVNLIHSTFNCFAHVQLTLTSICFHAQIIASQLKTPFLFYSSSAKAKNSHSTSK